MSSSQLTFIFSRGVQTTNQPSFLVSKNEATPIAGRFWFRENTMKIRMLSSGTPISGGKFNHYHLHFFRQKLPLFSPVTAPFSPNLTQARCCQARSASCVFQRPAKRRFWMGLWWGYRLAIRLFNGDTYIYICIYIYKCVCVYIYIYIRKHIDRYR